jgi:hypothetical protein
MKNASPAMAAIGLLSISALFSGCNSAQADWTKASSDNTVLTYEAFLAAHPRDSHVSEARAMILQLKDDAGWRDAQYTETAAAYRMYLQQFPRGSHVAAAQDGVTTIERAAAWKSAQDTRTAAAVRAFLQTYFTGPEVVQAKAKLRDLTSYFAHLATESTYERALRKKDQLKSRLNDSPLQFAITPASGGTFSVDAINMTEQDAKNACEVFRHEREACQVVKH